MVAFKDQCVWDHYDDKTDAEGETEEGKVAEKENNTTERQRG